MRYLIKLLEDKSNWFRLRRRSRKNRNQYWVVIDRNIVSVKELKRRVGQSSQSKKKVVNKAYNTHRTQIQSCGHSEKLPDTVYATWLFGRYCKALWVRK